MFEAQNPNLQISLLWKWSSSVPLFLVLHLHCIGWCCMVSLLGELAEGPSQIPADGPGGWDRSGAFVCACWELLGWQQQRHTAPRKALSTSGLEIKHCSLAVGPQCQWAVWSSASSVLYWNLSFAFLFNISFRHLLETNKQGTAFLLLWKAVLHCCKKKSMFSALMLLFLRIFSKFYLILQRNFCFWCSERQSVNIYTLCKLLHKLFSSSFCAFM